MTRKRKDKTKTDLPVPIRPAGDPGASGAARSPAGFSDAITEWLSSWTTGFDRFWFSPRSPEVLGWIRLFTGLIVFWSMFVWTFELTTFFGPDGLLPLAYRQGFPGATNLWWSHMDWVSSPTALMTIHIFGLLVVGLFAAGCFTRVTSVLAALLVISYGNRSFGAGFGLDQINAFLCLYCAVGNSGAAVSVDRWLTLRNNPDAQLKKDTITNIAIRLIQIHLCIVYFFAALGKLEGQSWWSGEAIWLSLASYEYQTVDMTWLANYMPLVAMATLVSLFWELLYPVLIWPKMTRPIMLVLAVVVHLGIGLCMGMMSFGIIMIVANGAFLCQDDSGSVGVIVAPAIE